MNSFSPSGAIRAGWQTFTKRSWFFIGVLLLSFVLSWAANMLDQGFGDQPDYHIVLFLLSFGLSVLVDIGVTAFLLKAVENPDAAAVKDLWHPQRYWEYLAASLLSGLVIVVGLILLIVPGIIAALMLVFTKYIVVARGMGPIEAMKESARITKGHRWQVLGFLALVALTNLLGLVCLVVGLLVSIPVTMFATVHAYRTLEQLASEPATV
jgi:uncharacterized membrane protein